jgi:hypothetical protein
LNLELIGKEGEEYVVSCLKEKLETHLHPGIVHVSLTDDGAGYDIITPASKIEGRIMLEVKTTTKPGDDFYFYLSRNEWNTARRNSNWYLVLVRKTNGRLDLFGYLGSQSLVDYYPGDVHPDFQWTSVGGRLGPDDVFSGLPGF